MDAPVYPSLTYGATMFHLAAYTNVFAGAVTLQDATAVADQEFSTRNNHLILTEPYNLLAIAGMGADLTAQELNAPSINAIAKDNTYPVMTAITVPSNPNIDDRRDYAPPLPMNEEIGVLQTASGAETESAFLWLGTPDWNSNLPRGIRRLTALATLTITKVANLWAVGGTLAFETTLRGGVYAIVGAELVSAGVQAFRINFPRRPLYMGRKTRPGTLATQTYGNAPLKPRRDMWGEWGRFHTFELPTVDVFASAAGAITPSMWLDLIYLGTDLSLLQSPGATTI